jgi:hypothetical protein
MKKSYRVMNVTRGNISFMVHPFQSAETFRDLSQHHARKRVRSSTVSVNIPHGQSVDLIAVTGLSMEDLLHNADLNKLIHESGYLRVLESVEDFDKVEPCDILNESDIVQELEDTRPDILLPPTFTMPEDNQ